MEDYRKLAMEAAMKIPYQTHSELLTSADKIYAWLTRTPKLTGFECGNQTVEFTLFKLYPYDGYKKFPYDGHKKSPSDADEDLSLPEMRAIMQR